MAATSKNIAKVFVLDPFCRVASVVSDRQGGQDAVALGRAVWGEEVGSAATASLLKGSVVLRDFASQLPKQACSRHAVPIGQVCCMRKVHAGTLQQTVGLRCVTLQPP